MHWSRTRKIQSWVKHNSGSGSPRKMGKRGAINSELQCTRGYIGIYWLHQPKKTPSKLVGSLSTKGRGGTVSSHTCPGLCAASDTIPGILQRAGVPKQDSSCTIHLLPAQRNISYSQARNWRAKTQPCYPSTNYIPYYNLLPNISPNPHPLASPGDVPA